MPVIPGFWSELWDTEPHTKEVTDFIRGGKADGTLVMYDARARLMVDNLPKGQDLTLQYLRSLLVRMSDSGAAASTLDGYRSAAIHYQKLFLVGEEEGVISFQKDPLLKEIVAAAKAKELKSGKRRLRGVMTLPMFEEFEEWLQNKNEPNLTLVRDAYRIARYTGLRKGAVSALLPCDLTKRSARGVDYLIMERQATKTPLMRVKKAEPTQKVVKIPIVVTIMEKYKRRALGGLIPRDEPIFTFDFTRWSSRVTDAAKELGWPDDVDWDGVHTFRHGYDNDKMEVIYNVHKKETNQNWNTFEHYATPPEERSRRVTFALSAKRDREE